MSTPVTYDQPNQFWDVFGEVWDLGSAAPDYQVPELIEYYANLIIIQYHNKPRAQATIGLFAAELLANMILAQIRDAYNLDDAVGVQLDVLGKYIGIDRYYRDLTLIDFFALTDYHEVDPDADPKFGFSDYTTFDGDNHNGTLTYNSIISSNNRLTDDAYRTILRLKILQNTINHSNQSIDDSVFRFFGTDIRPETSGVMTMAYFITAALTPLIKAAVYKKVLPKPLAVGMLVVNDVTGLMFGFTGYDGYSSPFAYGFSVYSDYDTLPGQVLVYDQVSPE